MYLTRLPILALSLLLAGGLSVALRADSTATPQGRDPTHHVEDDDGYVPPRGSGFEGEDGSTHLPAGSLEIEWALKADPDTRWAAVKNTLRTMFAGYVNGDLSAFMSGFSVNMEQDVSVFRNAVMGDFQRETSINVDIQIVEYRVTFDQICARFLWNRNSVDQKTGQVTVLTGETYVCFTRHDGFKVALMTGQVPFGQGDPQLQQQIQAGQPNDPLGAPPPTTPALGPPPVNPTHTAALGLVIDSFGPGDTVAIDIDTLSRRQVNVEAAFGPLPGGVAMPGEDVLIYKVSSVPAPIFYQGANGAEVFPCNYSSIPSLSNVRNANGPGLFGDYDDGASATFAVQKTDGGRALFILNGNTSVSYVRNLAGNPIQPGGTVDCTFMGF